MLRAGRVLVVVLCEIFGAVLVLFWFTLCGATFEGYVVECLTDWELFRLEVLGVLC